MRYTRAEIRLEALDHNLRVCRRHSSGRLAFAVVKANGYGHGMVQIARRLEDLGGVAFAVALVQEAIELREAGIRSPVLLMFGVEGQVFEPVFDYALTPVLWSRDEAAALSVTARKRGEYAGIHVKVDTGMGRMGVRWTEAEAVVREMAGMEGIRIEGIMSHLSRAEEDDPEATSDQLERLRTLLERLGVDGIRPPIVHVANSAGILCFPDSHFDAVRPGLMLYGYNPRMDDQTGELRPVMRWVSRIAYLKRVPPGSPLSYGGTFVTARESLIATVPVGYGDGYSRHLSNKGTMLVRNTPVPVVGRVCMDLTLVDVTAAPGVREGDEIVLMGPDAGAPDAWDMARELGTIPYEILTNVGGRVPRVWLENNG